MAGHSKWASIKHKKGAVDAKRGKLFSKLARAITIAARDGGGDVTGNPALALAVQKAKDNSMPKDNIQRAIDRGTGAGADAAAIESITYEGYGPAGVAVLVEVLTDNRNRTGAEIRFMFDRGGGSLGEPGSVAWQFSKVGVIIVDPERYNEDDLMVAIDAGADDVLAEDGLLKVIAEPGSLATVSSALREAGVEPESAEVENVSSVTVDLDSEKDARAVLKLIETLDDHDDVDSVHSNFDVSDELLAAIAE